MIIPDMLKIIINKIDERGYYICDNTGLFYLHKDGNFKYGIREYKEYNGFWPTKEEAKKFFDNWQELNSKDLQVEEGDIFKDSK